MGGEILHGSDMQRRYREKSLWQPLHRTVCTRYPKVCGSKLAFYRARQNGHWWHRSGDPDEPSATADAPPSRQENWAHYAVLAEQFVATLPVSHSCVLLTIVPSPATKTAEARAIAEALGLKLVSPQLQGLHTFDSTHLDEASAERWSRAFFEIAGNQIRQCLSAASTAVAG